MLASQGDEALKQFVDEKVSKKLLNSMGQERLWSELNQLRSKFAGAQRSGARPEGSFAAYIAFSNGESISFEMEADPPHRFVRIGIIGGKESSGDAGGCGGYATPSPQGHVASFAQLDDKLRAEAANEPSGRLDIIRSPAKIFLEITAGCAVVNRLFS